MTNNRREFLAALSMLPFVGLAPRAVRAQQAMTARRIGATGETLPAIGLGSSKLVEEIAANGEEPLRQILRTLVANGGRVVDTWPRNPANDGRFGRVINEAEFRDKLFVTSKIDRVGRDAGIAQFREMQKLYGRKTIDLMQVMSLTDVDTHWPTLKGLKDSGEARYIGVTVSEDKRHADLERFLEREKPDVVQVNYSITERQSEQRLLPMAVDRGLPVLINRPFMNGTYFKRLAATPLPPWAADFGCTSWSQFSLKYILANPGVTCVLTETSDPKHMEENTRTASGPLPDAAALRRMRELIDAL